MRCPKVRIYLICENFYPVAGQNLGKSRSVLTGEVGGLVRGSNVRIVLNSRL